MGIMQAWKRRNPNPIKEKTKPSNLKEKTPNKTTKNKQN
jgi:hypothetical protein